MKGPRLEYAELERRCDHAMEALGFLLRAFGSGAFDLERLDARHVERRCEHWARHLTIAGAHPATLDERGNSAEPHSGRDWRGLRRFFSTQRQSERDYVTHLRELMRQTMSRIEGLFSHDEQDDKSIAIWLASLRHSAEADSLEQLRKQVFATIDLVGNNLEARRLRHQDGLSKLSERLSLLKQQLDDAAAGEATDELTELFNRTAFDEHLNATTQLARFGDGAVSLIRVDVDHFRAMSAAYGPATSDRVLQRVADTLVRVASRRSDFVACLGGEEFAMVLADTSEDAARKLAGRIMDSVRKLTIEVGGTELCVTVSIGVAEHQGGERSAAWVGRAERALGKAKNDGHNCFVFA